MGKEISIPMGLSKEECKRELLNRYEPERFLKKFFISGEYSRVSMTGMLVLPLIDLMKGFPFASLFDKSPKLLGGYTYMIACASASAAVWYVGREAINLAVQNYKYKRNVDNFLRSEYAGR